MQDINNLSTVSDIVDYLEHLGRLPKNFDVSPILPFLEHQNEKIRTLAVKTVGKLKSVDYLDRLYDIALHDQSTMVKREAVSSIGRLRNEIAIDKLIKILANNDPKIVCQAIRGLLVFKGNRKVDKALLRLMSHENEIVVNIINKEYCL